MTAEPHSQLTTKDHAILQAMLERYRGPWGTYAKLLEQKVRTSSVCLRDDIAPDVVTLNTTLTYFVDGRSARSHVLVQCPPNQLPFYALSIHTLRGLALLGIAEHSSVVVDLGSGLKEILQVDDVVSQPEAEARVREVSKTLAQGEASARQENVLRFRSIPARLFRGEGMSPNDDPGPSAA